GRAHRREDRPKTPDPAGDLLPGDALLGLNLGGRPAARQDHGEGRAMTLAGALDGVDLDAAAVLLDDAVADRQTEAGPLADRLGGEEGVEDLAADLRRDAAAGVAERDAHRLVVGGDADEEVALAAHRLDRVQHEVHEDLAHPRGVGAEAWQ